MASKKQGSASADSPVDLVSAAGIVEMPQNFKGWLMFTRIDSGSDYEVVRAAEGN
jgi:hypothetical protein